MCALPAKIAIIRSAGRLSPELLVIVRIPASIFSKKVCLAVTNCIRAKFFLILALVSTRTGAAVASRYMASRRPNFERNACWFRTLEQRCERHWQPGYKCEPRPVTPHRAPCQVQTRFGPWRCGSTPRFHISMAPATRRGGEIHSPSYFNRESAVMNG